MTDDDCRVCNLPPFRCECEDARAPEWPAAAGGEAEVREVRAECGGWPDWDTYWQYFDEWGRSTIRADDA